MINKANIYVTNSINPYINLAFEEWLFKNCGNDEMIMYLWQNDNTVVIGKNQNIHAECNTLKAKEKNCRIARRMSGGGAVFHDLGNLNFTFITSDENYDLQKNLQIIKNACRMAGINAEISGRNDILSEGRKFSGNAFYNSAGKALHHGTIMINTNKETLSGILNPPKAKLEAKGVKSVKSRVINLCELNKNLDIYTMKANMVRAFLEESGIDAPITGLDITDGIATLAKKYESREFIYNSQPPFKYCFEKRFEWGNITINLDVKKGVITSAEVYTDSMDWNIADEIKSSLTLCPFDADAIKAKLPAYIKNDIHGLIAEVFI